MKHIPSHLTVDPALLESIYEHPREDWQDMAAKFCKQIEQELIDIDTQIVAVELLGPQTSYVSNNILNVVYGLKNSSREKLITYLEENFEEFDLFIKDKFSSREGFVSSYKNNADAWIYEHAEDIETDHNILGVFIEFYLEMESSEIEML